MQVELLEADDLTLDVSLERRQRRVAQRVLERPEQRERGDRERRDRGHEHRADDPAAQTEGAPPRSRSDPGHYGPRSR